MRTMKKVLSVVLVLMLAVSVFMPLTITASAWEVRTNDADLRIGFLNDTHIAKSGSGEAKSIVAFETFKTLGLEKIAFVGDNVYYPSASDDPASDQAGYDKLDNAIASTGWSWDDILVYAMGNHEFPQSNNEESVHETSIEVWKERTGFDTAQHVTYKGYHMIAVAPKSGANSYTHWEDYMKQEIEKALAADSTNDVDGAFPEGVVPNSTKPVFLYTHQPMSNTVTNGSTGAVSDAFIKYLSTRPQVVSIVGHKHRLAQHPENIGQDAGFTAFLSPMTAGGYQSQWACEEEGNITDSMCSQGSFMEIKDNVISFYRVDFLNGTYIGEPYVVDIPAIVADRTNEDTSDDFAHMPYRTEVRNKVTSEAAFPEDAAVTVEVVKTIANITFPNTATMLSYDSVQQDNFVRAYKVEVVDANGKVASSKQYQADFYKAPENRMESYTKMVGGLTNGMQYTVNVYPMTPLGSYGDPISATFETEKLKKDKDAIRVEAEKFTPQANLNRASDYASEGAILAAIQGGWLSGKNNVINKTEDRSPVTFPIKVNVPFAGKYDVQYAAGYQTSAHNLSLVELKVGDAFIGNNSTSEKLEDLSIDGTYPWKYVPLTLFKGNTVDLVKGENTIDVTVYLPTSETQPFLFCMDYIDFIPKTAVVNHSEAERIEFENCLDAIEPIMHTKAGKEEAEEFRPFNVSSSKASNGQYLLVDSETVEEGTTVDIPIPMYVAEDGMYNISYIGIGERNVKVYVDSKENGDINKKQTTTQLDAGKVMINGRELYETFEAGSAAFKHSFNAELEKGEHTLIFEICRRSYHEDVAHYLDYAEITSAMEKLTSTGELRFEFEDYQSQFTPKQPDLVEHEKASGGKLVRTGAGSFGQNDSVTLTFYVEKAGKYEMELHAATASYLSNMDIKIGDRVLYTMKNGTGENISEDKTYIPTYPMHKHVFIADLEAGYTKLVFDIAYRSNLTENDTAYAMDFIELRLPIAGTVSQDKVMHMEFEDLVGKIPGIPLSDGTTVNPSAGSSAGCSGGKYMFIDTEESDETYYEFTTIYKIEEAGTYKIDFVTTKGVSDFDVFLGSSEDGQKLAVTYQDTEINEGKNGTGKYPDKTNYYEYFSSSWAKVRYSTATVTLPAGYQEVTFRLKNRGAAAKDFAQYLDYFRIAPVESFTVADGVATVKAVYDTAVTGRAVLALYDGGKMVSVGTADVADGNVVDITAPANVAFTRAKLFVIENVSSLAPVAAVKEFTK